MSDAGYVRCALCGTRYHQAEGRACRTACPLRRACRLLRCPSCAYEMPAPTRLTRALERWFGVGARQG